jgi:hypothetical protein
LVLVTVVLVVHLVQQAQQVLVIRQQVPQVVNQDGLYLVLIK